MTKYLFLAVGLFGLVSVEAQQALDFFDQINISGKMHVVLEHGNANSIRIEEGGESEVKYEIDHGVLKVSRKELWNPNSYDEMIEVKVIYQHARQINGSAGAIVDHNGEVKSGDLGFHFDTGASGTFKLRAERVEAQAGEGGILRFTGSTETFEAKAVTGGNIKAGDLESIRAFVRANTGGFVSVQARDHLDAQASIGGNINYRGNPEKIELKTTIGGTINEM